MPIKFPCSKCKRPVAKNHKAIACDICLNWTHCKCDFISDDDYYKIMEDETNKWCCRTCINKHQPFTAITDEDLKLLISGKNIDTTIFDEESLPVNTNYIKEIESILPVENENELNVADHSDLCKYYTLSELNNTNLN